MREPKGVLVTRMLAMPANTNTNGDIFGGWILSQMDVGGGIMAQQYSKSRCATVAIDTLVFSSPVKVGDLVSCYAEVHEVGRSSMKIKVEAWRSSRETGAHDLVTEGTFTFVALNNERKPHPADPKCRATELKK